MHSFATIFFNILNNLQLTTYIFVVFLWIILWLEQRRSMYSRTSLSAIMPTYANLALFGTAWYFTLQYFELSGTALKVDTRFPGQRRVNMKYKCLGKIKTNRLKLNKSINCRNDLLIESLLTLI